jgi:hypothetical protein
MRRYNIIPLPSPDSSSPTSDSFHPFSKLSSLESLATFIQPRKNRVRTTFFALFVLLSASVYIVFLVRPTLALPPIPLRGGGLENKRPGIKLQSYPKWKQKHDSRPQLQLDESQELTAVSSFLASLPQNVIPLSVDPSQPIDPQLVLDFDTRSPRAVDEVRDMVADVWLRNPVILYSKVRLLLSHINFQLKAKS